MIRIRGDVLMALGSVFAAAYGLVCAPAALAQGAAPAGKAAVFIYRSDRAPVPAAVPVTVNAERAGDLANATFIVAIVSPGKVFLRAGGRILSSLSLQAAANRNYFVRIQAIPGLSPLRTEMRLVDQAAARGPLAESRFVGRGVEAEAAAKRVLGAAPAAAAPPPPPARVARPAPPPPAPLMETPRPPAPPPAPAPAAQSTPPAAPARAAESTPPPAPAPAAESTAAPRAAWEIALSLKAGAFKLANGSQVVGGLPSTYDATARPAVGLEAEWRSRKGPAVGGEIFYHKNKVTANGTSLSGEQKVVSVLLNGKYYFRVTDWFYPFAGAGIGLANSAYGGALTGKASGLAYQAMAGAEFRFGHVGLDLQYKHLASTTDDGAGEKVKVGGKGIFAGVSFIF